MPDTFKLSDNVCRKIRAYRFIPLSYSSEAASFKDITCNAENTFIIYPRSIRQVVSDIMMQPNANFGNKYEIMNLFTKGVQNGNDSMIVSSQINSAAYYGRKTPQSTYTISFNSLFPFSWFFTQKKIFGNPLLAY